MAVSQGALIPANSSPLSSTAVLKRWRDVLQKSLADYPPDVARAARKIDNMLISLRFDETDRLFSAEFYGAQNFDVEIEIDPHEWQFVPDCGCPRFRREQMCPHTFLVLQELKHEIEANFPVLCQSLLNLSRKPDWHPILNVLDELGELPTSGKSTDLPEPSRIVWRLHISKQSQYGSRIQLTPVEQRPSKKGGWTKGRAVDLRELSGKPLNSFPDEHDRQLIAVMQRELLRNRYGYGPDLLSTTDFALALAGHPRVVLDDAASTPVTVAQGSAGLKMSTDKKGMRLRPTLDGLLLDEYTVSGVKTNVVLGYLEKGTRLVMASCTPAWARCVNQHTLTNVVIPQHMEAPVLERLTELQERMDIRFAENVAAETVPAALSWILHLRRFEPAGGTAELHVTTSAGRRLVPGEGAAEFLTTQDGRRLCQRRDLAAERRRARNLADQLGLPVPEGTRAAWTLTHDDDLIDLMHRYHQQSPAGLALAWDESAGKAWEVVGEILPESLELQVKTDRDWFGLNGTVRIGDYEFKLIDLLTAIRNGSKHVRFGDNQWAVITAEFRDRLRALDDLLQINRGKIEFDQTMTPMVAELLKDTTIQQAAQKWHNALSRLDSLRDFQPELPETLQATLRDYQVHGYKWLRKLAEMGLGGCLADDMGLGKTVQAIGVLCDRGALGPTLVLAPTSVGFNWIRELEKFAPHLNGILYRDTDRQDVLDQLGPNDVLICSYGLLRRHAEELQAKAWATLIVDEAQFLKNSATQTAQVARDLNASWKLALTGTPVENRLAELWSIFRIVAPGLFGSWDRFRDRFASPIEKEHNAERQQALVRTVKPLILRRTKREVLTELPERTEIVLTAELSSEERRLYEDARLWAAAQLAALPLDNDNTARFQVLAMITRLRQLACHPLLVHQDWQASSAKLDLLLTTLDELRENGHRALVFSQFVQHLDIVRRALDQRGVSYKYLDGSTPPKVREAAVDGFQNGEGDVFLISLRAGGTGLNLTAADYVVHLDPWWNPAVEDQASDRAHRIGQTRPVTVYRLVAKETIEEQILSLHADKRKLVAEVLDGSDASARLSTQDLVDLIKAGAKSPR